MIANQILQLKENLNNSRRAVSFMGGTVGEIPAFDNLAAEIDSIPVGDANYAMVVDDGVAFRKSILPGALSNAKLVSVGGMTYKSKNLIDIPFIDATMSGGTEGVTVSVNWSSPIYVSAEECATTSLSIWRFKIDYSNGSPTYVTDNHLLNGGLRVAASTSKTIVAITYRSTYITEGKYSGIMISYGETRVPYEPYYDGLRDAKVTAVRVLGADGTEKARRDIPASITSLDGWGKGIEGYPNTYDFENSKQITRVWYGLMPITEWYYSDAAGYFSHTLSYSNRPAANVEYRASALCSEYSYGVNVERCFWIDSSGKGLRIKDSRFTTAAELQNHLRDNDVFLIYPLAEPITEEMPVAFDNILDIEGGGSIEFINEYSQSAPSDLRYMRRVV